MNRWKGFVILLAIASLGIVIAASLFAWPGVGRRAGTGHDWQDLPISKAIPAFDQDMRPVSSISILVSLAIAGILILFAAPRRIRRVADQIPSSLARLLRLMLVGFLVAVLVLVVSLISVVALGTFPLAMILLVILFVAGLMGFIALSYALGRGLIKRAGWQRFSPLYSYLLGLLVLYALAQIPWAGLVLFLIFISLGLGATILSNFGSGQPWNLNPLMEEE